MNTSEELLHNALPRYHADREVSRKVRYYGVHLLAVKFGFMIAIFGAIWLSGYLQRHMLDSAVVTGCIVAFCIACIVGFAFFKALPRIHCSGCKQRLKHEYIKKAGTEVLICRSCKRYADLGVSHIDVG